MRPILDVLEDFEQFMRAKVTTLKQNIQTKKAENFLKRKHILRLYLRKAGFKSSSNDSIKWLLIIVGIIDVGIAGFFITRFSLQYGFSLSYAVIVTLLVLLICTPLLVFLTWFSFYTILDIIVYRRRVEIEDVLPDFLQLMSTNVRAGMPIDRALWFAVRPRFGILAKEMEGVAKANFVGAELEVSLREFAEKYESPTLKRSMSLLIEGLNAGGEVGKLLERIASNVQQTNLMKQEMAASVTTYVIFISVAVILGAPFLFALSDTLIGVIQGLGNSMDIPMSGSIGLSFSFSSDAIDISDFRMFAFISLAITSLFASMIISTIQKGNVKAGIKYIPMFMIATVSLFFIFSFFFGRLFSSIF